MDFFYDTERKLGIKISVPAPTQEELNLALSFLQYIPADNETVFIDVGANWGLYSLFAKFVPKCTIYALEPNLQAYQLLTDHIRENNIENVKPFFLGLSDKNGKGELNVCETDSKLSTLGVPNNFDNPKKVEVNLITLDTFMKTYNIPFVHFINIDVQGYEQKVLEGGKDTIGRYRPLIKIGYNQSNMSQHRITQEVMVKTIGFLSYAIAAQTVDTKILTFNKEWLKNLPAFGKRVYSLGEQDGILSYIFQCIQPENKRCVEIGFDSIVLETSSGANTPELLLNRGWSGVLLDRKNEQPGIHLYKSDYSKESILNVLKQQNIPENFDYLSLNTRTRDLWILSYIFSEYKPRVITAWYNCHVPIDNALTASEKCPIEYDDSRGYGASLKCFELFAKDYHIFHVSEPHTVYLIRKEILPELVKLPDFKNKCGLVWKQKPGSVPMFDYRIWAHCKNEQVALNTASKIYARYISIPNATMGSILKNMYQRSHTPKIRLGNNSEGGYVIAGNIPYDCILSASVSDAPLAFEEDLAKLNRGVPFYIFRPSFEPVEEYKEFMFVRKQLNSVETERYTNLQTYLKNHKNSFVKVVAAGMEYEWAKVLRDFPELMENIAQLVIQVHHSSKTPERAVELLDMFSRHFYMIHIHGNNKHGFAYDTDSSLFIDTFQLTLINKKFITDAEKFTDIPEIFPGELDKPDNRTEPDVFLYTYPLYSKTIGKYRISPWNNPYGDLFDFDLLESSKFGVKVLVIKRNSPWGQQLQVRIEDLETGNTTIKHIGSSSVPIVIANF